MNRKTVVTTGLFVGLFLGVGVIQYFAFKKANSNNRKAQDSKEDEAPKAVVTSSQIQSNAAVSSKAKPKAVSNPVFPLQIGSQGKEVKQLQIHLLKHHGWVETTLGVYDEVTHKRVLQFLKVPKITQEVYSKLITKPIKLQ